MGAIIFLLAQQEQQQKQ